jgi:hypothetical protein
MKNYLTLISMLILLASAAHAELTELVRLYGPPEGSGFYHICAPGDVNGDGFDDFIISSPTRNREVRECENGYARLYFGSNPIDTSNYITIPAVCPDFQTGYTNAYGEYCSGVGDINDDGFADFLIGDPGYDNFWTECAGAGFIYFGGVSLDTLPSWQLIGYYWYGTAFFTGTGDINGDSYDDAAMGITLSYHGVPAHIFLGGESPDSLYDYRLNTCYPGTTRVSIPNFVGDYNGDDIDDILISDYEYGDGHGMAYMYFGSETGFDDPDLIFKHRGGWGFGRMVCGTDWNNDGFTDLFIGCSQDSVFGYKGSQNPDARCDVIFIGGASHFGKCISGGSDLNWDGYPEIAISDCWWGGEYRWQGRVLIYYGGAQPDTIPDLILEGQEEGARFGWETAFPGDINGDGYPEFMASSSYYYEDQSKAFVTIYTTGNVSVPDDGQVPDDYDFNLTSYPNPFNAATMISFDLPVPGNARLEVYNLIGQKIAALVDGRAEAGPHSVIWNADHLPSGIYFARLKIPGNSVTLRMMLLK